MSREARADALQPFHRFILAVLVLTTTLCSCSIGQPRSIRPSGSITNVPDRPGVVAWSPDSSGLAVIEADRVCIRDSDGALRRCFEDLPADFIEWAPGDKILAVSGAEGRAGVYLLDPGSGTTVRLTDRENVRAVRWLQPPGIYALFSMSFDERSIATFALWRVSVMDEGKEREASSVKIHYPPATSNEDAMAGWRHAAVRPLTDEWVLQRYQKPPVFPPYVTLSVQDLLTGDVNERIRVDGHRRSVPYSWSPEGTRLAYSAAARRLTIVDLRKGDQAVPTVLDAMGDYPSWNPAGSQIFIGGIIVQSDGTLVDWLVGNRKAVGNWSPDGTRLAVVADGEVRLFDGFKPEIIPPDRIPDASAREFGRKIRVLKSLLADGLISREEYDSRVNRLKSGEQQ